MAAAVASSAKGEFDSSPPCVATAPSGIQTGDLLVAFVAGNQNDPTNLSISGWTYVDGITSGGESLAIFKKIAVLADESAANYSVAASDSEIVGAVILRITGASDDFAVRSKQEASNGIFTTMDLTPATADSLILFAVFEYDIGNTNSGYAIVTSNPSWTEAQELTPAFGIGSLSVAHAIRPEITSTGDFSVTDDGTYLAIAVALNPIVSTSVSPAVVAAIGTVVDPTLITGGAGVAPAVIPATVNIQAPVVTTPDAKWVNDSKSAVASFDNLDKS